MIMENAPVNELKNLSLVLEKEMDPFFIFDHGQILYASKTLTVFLSCSEPQLPQRDFVKNILAVGETGMFSPDGIIKDNRQSAFQLFDVPVINASVAPIRCDINISPISWHGKQAHVCLIKRKTSAMNTEQSVDYKIKLIGTISAGIIHDINNMMTSLIGFSELAIEETRSMETTHSYLNEILSAANRAKELINKVLWIENPPDPASTDIIPIMNSVVKLLNVRYPQKTKVSYRFEPKSLIIDGSDFFQLILNLCINAHQAMEEQQGLIHLIVDRQRINQQKTDNPWHIHQGDYLLIEVLDNGQGVDQPTMNYMFDLCFTTKKNGQGTGIGLNIVKSIVRKYKGFIYLESKHGEGTRFKVYLPI